MFSPQLEEFFSKIPEDSLKSHPRFLELFKQGYQRPAPNGKEEALLAFKRDRNINAWKRSARVTEKNAELLGNSGLGVKILALEVNLLFIIWEYLQPNELIPCMIMAGIFQSYDYTIARPLKTQPLQALEQEGKRPNLKTQTAPKIELSIEEKNNLFDSIQQKNYQMLEAALETIPETSINPRNDAHLSTIIQFGIDTQIYRSLYFLLGKLVNSYGPCARRWNGKAEKDQTEYLDFYNLTTLYVNLIEHHFSEWIKTYPAGVPGTVNIKSIHYNYLKNANATLKECAPPHPLTRLNSLGLYPDNQPSTQSKSKKKTQCTIC